MISRITRIINDVDKIYNSKSTLSQSVWDKSPFERNGKLNNDSDRQLHNAWQYSCTKLIEKIKQSVVALDQ